MAFLLRGAARGAEAVASTVVRSAEIAAETSRPAMELAEGGTQAARSAAGGGREAFAAVRQAGDRASGASSNADRIGYGLAAAATGGATTYGVITGTNTAQQAAKDLTDGAKYAAKAMIGGATTIGSKAEHLYQEGLDEAHKLTQTVGKAVTAPGVSTAVEGILSVVIIGGIAYLTFETYRFFTGR